MTPCKHENFYWHDKESAEATKIEDKDAICMPCKCDDCGKEGEEIFLFERREWGPKNRPHM